MLDEGNYYLRVIAGDTATRYTLDLQVVSAPTPEGGNGFADAAYTGYEYVTRSYLMDSMNGDDRRDYSKLTVSSSRTADILLQTLRGDASMEPLADLNGNGVRDEDEVVATSANTGVLQDRITAQLSAGVTYYLRIYRAVEVNTLYQLALSSL